MPDTTRTHQFPAGILIPGTPSTLALVFGSLVPLQPVAWRKDGLVCVPRAGDPHETTTALDRCPVEWRPLEHLPAWPPLPSRWMGGWYVRTADHAPAPSGVRELVQAVGDGFGPHAHPTTAMCLATLDALPDGPATDVGCGSGLLMQAWVALGRGPAIGLDIDATAIAHARASLALAGMTTDTRLIHGPLESALSLHGGPIWLVNLPPVAHRAVHACMQQHPPPQAMLCAGFRGTHREAVLTGYRRAGLRPVSASRTAGWECWRLRR